MEVYHEAWNSWNETHFGELINLFPHFGFQKPYIQGFSGFNMEAFKLLVQQVKCKISTKNRWTLKVLNLYFVDGYLTLYLLNQELHTAGDAISVSNPSKQQKIVGGRKLDFLRKTPGRRGVLAAIPPQYLHTAIPVYCGHLCGPIVA